MNPSILATLGFAVTLSSANAEPTEFVNDKSHQYIGFEVSHFGFSPVRGRFRDVDALLIFDAEDKNASRVSVTIDAVSVDTDHPARDEHLRSADFFDTEQHPDITFESTGFDFETETSGTLTGDLTLLSKTKPMQLNFELLRDGPFPLPGYHSVRTLGIKANGTTKRTDWGMDTYAGEAIGDEVDLTIQFDAVHCEGKAASAPSCTYGRKEK